MANWICIDGAWHVLARVDAAGWRSTCGRVVNEEASVVDVAPPKDEPECPKCHDLSREPKP